MIQETHESQRAFVAVALGLVLVVTNSTASAAEVIINLRSGNGMPGGTDSSINMLLGPADGPFPGAFTPADFNAARGGPAAFISTPLNGLWQANLTSDPSAQWISTIVNGAGSGGTALYAVDFTLPNQTILSGTLDFNYLVDNNLGDTINEGLFINGVALAGTKLLGGQVLSNFQMDHSFLGLDIASLLNPGLNTLFINGVDLAGPGALQFSSTITVQTEDQVMNPVVPEPQSLAIWVLVGVLGIAAHRRRRKTA